MNALIVLPILLPLLVGASCVVVWRYVTAQRILTLAGSIVYLAVAVVLLERVASQGIQAVQKGAWIAPFGITLVADMFSAVMVATTGVVTLVIVIYSLGTMDRGREAYGYYPLFNILIMGVSGAFLTGDIFNLFVWFEVLLISSFVLLALGGERAQLEGAIKYVTLNLVASAFLPGGGGHPLRHGRFPQHGRSVAAARGRGSTGAGDHPRHPVPGGLRHQGGHLPVVLLVAGLLPHAAGGGLGHLRRAVDQGGRLRPDSGLHAAVPQQRRLHPHDHPVGRRHHHGDRRARGGGPVRVPPAAVLPHREPDRLHGHGARFLHPPGAGGHGVLHRPQHLRQDQPVPGERRFPPAARHLRPQEAGRPLPRPIRGCPCCS